MQLKQFYAGKTKYGIAVGSQESIIVEYDFCHVFEDNQGFATLRDWRSSLTTECTISMKDIIASAQPFEDFERWAHYWGIKSRVHDNYKLLLQSMKQRGISTEGMPEWGKRKAD